MSLRWQGIVLLVILSQLPVSKAAIHVELYNQPGIYYERLGQVKLKRGEWKLAMVVNTTFDTTALHRLLFLSVKLQGADYPEGSHRAQHGRDAYLNARLRDLGKTRDRWLAAAEANFGASLPIKEMQRMNGMAQYLREHPDEAVMSENSKFTLASSSIDLGFRAIEKQMMELENKYQDLRIRPFANLTWPAEQRGSYDWEFDTLIDKIQDNLSAAIDAGREAEVELLSYGLFTEQRFTELINSMEEKCKDARFSAEKNFARINSLKSLWKLKFGWLKQTLFITVQLPLSDDENVTGYYLGLLPAIQPGDGNETLSISPRLDYLFVRGDEYKFINGDEMGKCVESRVIICPEQWFEYTTKGAECKAQILLKNDTNSWEDCNIRYARESKITFVRRYASPGWLLSAPNGTVVSINCRDEGTLPIEIQGVGALSSEAECTMRYGDDEVTVFNKTMTRENTLLIPAFNLSFKLLAPIIPPQATQEWQNHVTEEGRSYPLVEVNSACVKLVNGINRRKSVVTLVQNTILIVTLIGCGAGCMFLGVIVTIRANALAASYSPLMREAVDGIEIGEGVAYHRYSQVDNVVIHPPPQFQ